MRRFMFQLAPLLKIRKQKEDAVKQELAQKNRQILAAREAMAQMQNQMESATDDERRHRTVSPDIHAMRALVSYRHRVLQELAGRQKQIAVMTGESEAITKRLGEAVRKRRALELLRDRRHAAWNAQARRADQKFTDDVSQQGFIRKKRAAPSHEQK